MEVRGDIKEHIRKGLDDREDIELIFPESLEQEDLMALAPDAEVIVGWKPARELLLAAERMKLYINPWAGVQHIIGLFRELLGAGEILGYKVLNAQWYTPNQLMILAPGAFFALGIVIGIFNWIKGPEPEENK